jgi:hypothetical protein
LKDFIAAAKDDLGDVGEENPITFQHWGTEVTFFEPSDGQQAIMLAMGGRTMDKRAAGTFIQLFIELGDDDTQRYFQDLLMDRKSGFGLSTKGGIFDIWENLMEEWSGKATPPASESPKPRRATGRASTGTTRAKASTSSSSRGRASST